MGKRQALLIGVPEYLSPQIEPLSIVRQDLNTLEDALQRSKYEVTVVGRKGAIETSRSRIRSQLKKACKQTKGVETLFLYLSGHGLHHNGRDYLVPADASMDDPEELEEYLVSLDLGSALDQCLAQTIVVVVDACREGVKLAAKSVSLSGWSSGECRQAVKRNLAIVFGCSQGQLSHFVPGDEGFSLFTRALAEVMDPEHDACTFLDVIAAAQKRLDELSGEYQKPSQKLRVFQEFGADREEQRRIICEGVLPEEPEDSSFDGESFRAVSSIPFQMPAIPANFVPRPEHSNELKRRLLLEDVSGVLVVSAIYGLGGIGKSVLATVLGV